MWKDDDVDVLGRQTDCSRVLEDPTALVSHRLPCTGFEQDASATGSKPQSI